MNEKQTPSLDTLLYDITKTIKPVFGAVRELYTPYGGTQIEVGHICFRVGTISEICLDLKISESCSDKIGQYFLSDFSAGFATLILPSRVASLTLRL